jgi:cytochrome b subunit of formate dehydrogenase
MLGQQSFGTICDSANANFVLPFRPNLRPFFVLPSQIKVDKEMQVAEEPGQMQVPDLNQKMKVQKKNAGIKDQTPTFTKFDAILSCWISLRKLHSFPILQQGIQIWIQQQRQCGCWIHVDVTSLSLV